MLYYNQKAREREEPKIKRFVYDVMGFEYEDTEAFGKAWKDAKEVAKGLGVGIYRTVYNDETERREVYCKSGCFLRVDLVKPESVALF